MSVYTGLIQQRKHCYLGASLFFTRTHDDWAKPANYNYIFVALTACADTNRFSSDSVSSSYTRRNGGGAGGDGGDGTGLVDTGTGAAGGDGADGGCGETVRSSNLACRRHCLW